MCFSPLGLEDECSQLRHSVEQPLMQSLIVGSENWLFHAVSSCVPISNSL